MRPRLRQAAALALLCCCIAAPAAAQSRRRVPTITPAQAQPCTEGGTWAGTLGGTPLMLQLNWDRLGAYYLNVGLSGAVLRPVERDPLRWAEYDEAGKRTGTLHISCFRDAMRGEREGLQGEREPLQARRAADNSYNQRRLAAAELAVLRTLSQQGRTLELVAVREFPALTTLQIRQARAGEAAINARLRKALLEQLDNHLQCQALLRAQGRTDRAGGDELTVQRVFWRGNILSLELWLHGYCGGVEGYAGLQQFTFDTATGEELPLPLWLAPEYRPGIPAETPLHDALVLPHILRGRKSLDELPEAKRDCAEFELGEVAMPVAVEDRGMVFSFQYSGSMDECRQSFVLPWPELQAALSPDGRRWLQAMRGELPR